MPLISVSDDRYAIVDECDMVLLSSYSWRIHRRKKGGEYIAATGRNDILMHRVITNAPKGTFVDHKNGNTFDNRRDNLRIATITQNSANRRKISKSTSSQFKGVCRRGAKWTAAIGVERRQIFLGRFATETEAATAYNDAAKKLWGEFARLNQV